MGDKEFARKIPKAYVVTTTPNVCKSPTAPVPYVSFSKFDEAVYTADTVKMTRCVTFTMNSRLSRTFADEGGVGGGMKSQVFGGMCRPFKHQSSTVFAQGGEICRHDMLMEVNCAGPDGPGNTYGKVLYAESLSCASVTSEGEIVVEQDERSTSEDVAQEGAASESAPTQTPQAADPGESQVDEQLGGFGKEADRRISDELEGMKELGKDLADIATDPDARQAAKEALNETIDAAKEDPVGFGLEAGGAIAEDLAEPFGTSYEQAMEGKIGEASASVAYGILNIFNPLKKIKIAQKIGKLGSKKGKRRDGSNEGDGDNGGDGNNGDGNDGDSDGGRVTEIPGVRRPRGVPDDWVERPSKTGGGKRWVDPNNPHNSVRSMPGDPNSPYSNSREPYVRWTRNGQSLDTNGNVVPKNTPGAHISFENFDYKP